MKTCWIFVYLITMSYGVAQVDSPPRALPEARIVRLTLDTQNVTVLHLRPGYVSSVRLPEDVSSVVVGNPDAFKAEHSEAEARLVFLKPTTTIRAETNALITTRTGHDFVASGKCGELGSRGCG
jgi:type IV secretory pathway VirB9-like protein